MTENWKPALGYGGYEVSDLGHVRRIGGRPLRPIRDKDGYGRVDLFGRLCRIHILVAEAFLDGRPDGFYLVRHLNGDPRDNRAANLAFGTQRENALDSIEHGTHAKSSRTHCPHNHEYDEVNTYVDRRGHRFCRACNREAARRSRARNRKGALL